MKSLDAGIGVRRVCSKVYIYYFSDVIPLLKRMLGGGGDRVEYLAYLSVMYCMDCPINQSQLNSDFDTSSTKFNVKSIKI